MSSSHNSFASTVNNGCTTSPKRNDNSNPQQGTDITFTHQAMISDTDSAGSIDPLATPKPYTKFKIPPSQKDSRKLFVGGLPQDVTEEEFRMFFEQFGKVMDSIVMVDRNSHRSRGFGFVTYEDEEVARKMLTLGSINPQVGAKVGRVQMRDKCVEIKAAEPRDSTTTRDFESGHNSRSIENNPYNSQNYNTHNVYTQYPIQASPLYHQQPDYHSNYTASYASHPTIASTYGSYYSEFITAPYQFYNTTDYMNNSGYFKNDNLPVATLNTTLLSYYPPISVSMSMPTSYMPAPNNSHPYYPQTLPPKM